MSEHEEYIYGIIMKGAYRHEIRGVFASSAADDEPVPGLVHLAALQVMKAEPDDYHSLQVLRCPINRLIEDAQEVARYRRKDQEVSLVHDKEGNLVEELDKAQRRPSMEMFSAVKVTVTRDKPPFSASWFTGVKPVGSVEWREIPVRVRKENECDGEA